jgi:hypothetical protein
MIPLLLATTLSCVDVKDIISGVRQHENLSETIKQEIIVEMLLVAPPGCIDLETELSR